MQLIDTHAHLEGFADSSRMVSNAKASGVVSVIAVSADLETCKRTIGLADEYPDFIYPALGVHPQEAGKDNEAAFTFIEEHLDRCVAVGEIGLDYWAKVDKEAQNRAFSRLLDFALSRDLPVSIHSRGAWEECYRMASEKKTQKAVFHWFSGSTETLRLVIDSGYLVSATPALEYSKAHRAAIREAPIESLVLETDSPVKYHGKEAEPADVARTLHFVAELKDMVVDDVASKTTMNARRLFSLG
jgi:TatD DNase family protein